MSRGHAGLPSNSLWDPPWQMLHWMEIGHANGGFGGGVASGAEIVRRPSEMDWGALAGRRDGAPSHG